MRATVYMLMMCLALPEADPIRLRLQPELLDQLAEKIRLASPRGSRSRRFT